MGIKPNSAIDGNHILYHFLQKDLFESDIWLFQMLSARLVASLGIWFHPDLYKKVPILLPYTVRDPSCRKQNSGVESWGSPNHLGYLRDDNSLVKALPKSLSVISSSQSLYDGRRIGNGFVASHVWRKITASSVNANLASRDPLLNTFIPNLVWLPAQVSKLTDREGTFTQLYLQALSAKIYRHIQVPDALSKLVNQAWSMIEVPEGIPKQGLPDINELSFFEPSENFFSERRKKIKRVVDGMKTVLAGETINKKIVTTRYGEGLHAVSNENLALRVSELQTYLDALE